MVPKARTMRDEIHGHATRVRLESIGPYLRPLFQHTRYAWGSQNHRERRRTQFYTEQHRYYYGIDVHTRSMYVCALNQASKFAAHRNIPTKSVLFFDWWNCARNDERPEVMIPSPYERKTMPEEHLIDEPLAPIDSPDQFDAPAGVDLALVQANQLIRGPEARDDFEVDGASHTAAVLDTGLRVTHVDFTGRVLAQVNFTTDNGGDPADAADGDGHGTNVGGIVVANGDHVGIAPGANIVPIKVLSNNGGGSFAQIRDALQWVIDHREVHNITVVCMSLGGAINHADDDSFANDAIRLRIQTLRDARVPVVIAAGNDFFTHGSQMGMSFPGILREGVSVGAVYDDFGDGITYSSGAQAHNTAPDRITPFSQRLHETVHAECCTDIFAPGAPIRSAGINNDHGESTQHGTSQAAPVIAGVILLMQQLHQRLFGGLPEVADLVRWMRDTAVVVNDGDDENDNVDNTGLDFPRVDAFAALAAIEEEHAGSSA